MELAIKEKKENKALGRAEVSCEISYGKAMPSRKEVREALCTAIGCDPQLTVVVFIKGGFGTNRAHALAHVYKDKKAMGVERHYLLVRDSLAEKKKKQAAAKAAPAKK